MRKKFLILFSIFILFLTPNIVKAASANVQISAPSSVYVGDNVTVSVTVSSSAPIGSWQYTISYDDSILSYVSTTAEAPQRAANVSTYGKTSVTYSWTFKAIGNGNGSFNIDGIVIGDFDTDEAMDIGGSTSASINVIKPSNNGNNGSNNGNNGGHSDYKYSDDNNLSSLNIEGFDLNFDSSVTEYSVSVPNDTKKVKIGATANDGNASVSGIGDYDVKEGNNEIKIVVTAENGDTKTYKINVVVKELSPIEVKVNDKTYSVVRKNDKLPKVNATYKSSTILIKGESVPCYHSEITDIYLIGLMDDKGKVELFNYDSKSDKFSVYNEINISGLYISLVDNKDVPAGYKSGLVKIGDKEYNGYLKDGAYSLLYGINLETGEKNFYSYDSSEGTLQKYVSSNVVNNKYYSYIIIGLIGLCIFEFIMLIISVVSKNKQLKKYLHNKLDVKTEFEKSLENGSDNEAGTSIENDDSELAETDAELEHSDNTDQDNDDVSDDEDDTESEETEETDDVSEEKADESNVSFDTEEIEEGLGHTALISRSVSNVYNNTKNRKESIKERKSLRKKKKNKKDDDDMFKF